jgi:RNA-directed DNA polymerase
MPRIEIPNDKRADIRYKVKQMTTRSTIGWSLSHLLQKLNPILRGWGNYFRFCTGASAIFASIDWYVGDRIWRWLMKKHGSLSRKKTTIRRLPSRLRPTRRVWREGATEQFLLSSLVVERFQRGWMRAPAFAMVPGKLILTHILLGKLKIMGRYTNSWFKISVMRQELRYPSSWNILA